MPVERKAGAAITSEDLGTSGPAVGDQRAGRRHPGLTILKELVFVVVGALVVSSLLRAFVGQMFVIPSDSMQNTLLQGDRVVVQKLTDVRRGDVVVFADPGGWLPDEPTEEPTVVGRILDLIGLPTSSSPGHLIKRVVGMPGDAVVCCDEAGKITVNGAALDETAYLYTSPTGEQVAPSDTKFSVVVPRDHIFVLGDHRDDSRDSRCHLSDSSTLGTGQPAFVPLADVVGPALVIASPFDRAKRLGVPSTFAGVPAPAAAPALGTIDPTGVDC